MATITPVVTITHSTILDVAGMNYRQSISTVRCNASTFNPHGPALSPKTASDRSEATARMHGHKLVYAVPHANVLTSHREAKPNVVRLQSGDVVRYLDTEGNAHTLRVSRPRWNDTAVVEILDGPFA